MTVYEVGTIVLVLVLASAAATAAIYLGLLNWMGAFYVVRCAACHHLTFSSANRPRGRARTAGTRCCSTRCTRRGTRAA